MTVHRESNILEQLIIESDDFERTDNLGASAGDMKEIEDHLTQGHRLVFSASDRAVWDDQFKRHLAARIRSRIIEQGLTND